MSYHIQYPVVNQLERKYIARKGFPSVLVAIAVCVALLMVTVYAVGTQTIFEYIIPGNNEITVSAFYRMQNNLSDGMAIKDAISVFCTDIIEAANIQ